jgi:hypothetical protein
MSGIAKIDETVPFGECIYWWLRFHPEKRFDVLVRHSAEYEKQYLAWQEVKIARNPYFENGTGFEGYFVGDCTSPEQALEKILQVGETVLRNLFRLHPHEHRFHTTLLKALTADVADLRAISEWSAELGAEVARLHCNVSHNKIADHFQQETYRLVRTLPPICYVTDEHTIEEHYSVVSTRLQADKMTVNPASLTESQQEAWLVAQSMSRFGHPLVREYLSLADQ